MLDSMRAFFTNITTFAGVVFAVVLAARQVTPHVRRSYWWRESRYRLWDSMAVTSELAAAALFATLWMLPASGIRSVGAVVVGLAALFLYTGYFVAYGMWLANPEPPSVRRPQPTKPSSQWLMVLATVLPCAAIAAAVWVLTSPTSPFGWPRDDVMAAAVGWLTMSGSIQSVIWYYTAWGGPTKPAGSESGGDLPPTMVHERSSGVAAFDPQAAGTTSGPEVAEESGLLTVAAHDAIRDFREGMEQAAEPAPQAIGGPEGHEKREREI